MEENDDGRVVVEEELIFEADDEEMAELVRLGLDNFPLQDFRTPPPKPKP